MSQNHFPRIQQLIRNHLYDAEKKHTGNKGANPGPTPDQSYSGAFATAVGAYAARGITAAQWAQLDTEVRSHRDAFQGDK